MLRSIKSMQELEIFNTSASFHHHAAFKYLYLTYSGLFSFFLSSFFSTFVLILIIILKTKWASIKNSLVIQVQSIQGLWIDTQAHMQTNFSSSACLSLTSSSLTLHDLPSPPAWLRPVEKTLTLVEPSFCCWQTRYSRTGYYWTQH